MTNGLLIYGEIFAHFLIYWEALPHHMALQLLHSEFPYTVYEDNLIFFFISVESRPFFTLFTRN
jgi:hypothetical protein